MAYHLRTPIPPFLPVEQHRFVGRMRVFLCLHGQKITSYQSKRDVVQQFETLGISKVICQAVFCSNLRPHINDAFCAPNIAFRPPEKSKTEYCLWVHIRSATLRYNGGRVSLGLLQIYIHISLGLL